MYKSVAVQIPVQWVIRDLSGICILRIRDYQGAQAVAHQAESFSRRDPTHKLNREAGLVDSCKRLEYDSQDPRKALASAKPNIV